MTVLAALQRQSNNTLDQMIKLVHKHLHVEGYSKKEVTNNQSSITKINIDQIDNIPMKL